MRVSHETIYRSLFIQARGALKKELLEHLRSKRRIRRSQHSRIFKDGRGQIPEAISIRERPAEVEDRTIPGHWGKGSGLCTPLFHAKVKSSIAGTTPMRKKTEGASEMAFDDPSCGAGLTRVIDNQSFLVPAATKEGWVVSHITFTR
jgi:hypothetical protein